MNKKELEAFAREAAKGLKTEKDLNEFSQMLTKVAVEATLNAELDDHLVTRDVSKQQVNSHLSFYGFRLPHLQYRTDSHLTPEK